MDNHQNKQQIAWGLSLIFLLLILCLSIPVFAGEPPALRLIDSETTTLNLTPPQQQKLTALESASHAQSGQLIMQIDQLRQKLSDLYGTYGFDVAEVRRMNLDLNRVQGQLLDLRFSEQMQLRQILTPDQFAQLQAAMHKHPVSDGHRRHGPNAAHDPAAGHRQGSRNGDFHP